MILCSCLPDYFFYSQHNGKLKVSRKDTLKLLMLMVALELLRSILVNNDHFTTETLSCHCFKEGLDYFLYL